jgi:hypothetical protein
MSRRWGSMSMTRVARCLWASMRPTSALPPPLSRMPHYRSNQHSTACTGAVPCAGCNAVSYTALGAGGGPFQGFASRRGQVGPHRVPPARLEQCDCSLLSQAAAYTERVEGSGVSDDPPAGWAVRCRLRAALGMAPLKEGVDLDKPASAEDKRIQVCTRRSTQGFRQQVAGGGCCRAAQRCSHGWPASMTREGGSQAGGAVAPHSCDLHRLSESSAVDVRVHTPRWGFCRVVRPRQLPPRRVPPLHSLSCGNSPHALTRRAGGARAGDQEGQGRAECHASRQDSEVSFLAPSPCARGEAVFSPTQHTPVRIPPCPTQHSHSNELCTARRVVLRTEGRIKTGHAWASVAPPR